MRVAIVISGLGLGGAEMVLANLIDRLRNKIEFTVISMSDAGPVGRRLRQAGVPLYTLNMRSAASALVATGRLAGLIRKLRPDVVHTWMYHADLVGGLAARFAGAPSVVWSIHSFNIAGGMLRPTTRLVLKACAALSWKLPTKIISCSDAGVAVHIGAGYDPKKFVVIPNGVDMSRFRFDQSASASVREELDIPTNARIVGLVGRFDVQKNHLGFIQAAGHIHARYPDVCFVLAGKDVDSANSSLTFAIQDANVGKKIRLLGMRDDIPRLVSAMDVLASSSHGEAFPLVLVEAMACGVPCAVTNVGDCADIVGDAGHVVEAGDMSGLAESICGLLSLSPEERRLLGTRAAARVRDRYDLEKVARIYDDFYRTLHQADAAKSNDQS